jgi:superfamily II DNA or RNA helicase
MHHNGILSATTAFGKTVAAIGLIAKLQTNALILVHTKALQEQWVDRLTQFLEIDDMPDEQPRRRGRRKKFSPIGTTDNRHGTIDVVTMQSCLTADEVQPFVGDYGLVIVDECHHVSAVSFEKVLKEVTADRVYGLTATPIRKDGMQPIIFMQCGPIRYCADAKSQILKQSFERLLVSRFTSFRSIGEEPNNFMQLTAELAADASRNALIVADVAQALQDGRTPIVLTTLTSHVRHLSEQLASVCKNVIALVGSDSAKEKRAVRERLNSLGQDEPLVIVATGKYVGEGFDYPRLDTLFMALPVSWKGIVAQYAGRLHRDFEDKTDVRIYDYVDIRVDACEAMYRKRLKGYAAIGYKHLDPSASLPIAMRSLFDTIDTDNAIENAETILDGTNYLPPLAASLRQATKSILISAPKLRLRLHQKLLHLLEELSHRGISIEVLTQADEPQAPQLRALGFTTRTATGKLRCIIIDKTIVWYGSINFLGPADSQDNCIRIVDGELAEKLLEGM